MAQAGPLVWLAAAITAVFVLAGLSAYVMVACAWPAIRRVTRNVSKSTLANVLLALQVAPVALASLVMACFAVPSFLRF